MTIRSWYAVGISVGVLMMLSLVAWQSQAIAEQAIVSTNPLPLGAPANATYTIPQNLAGKTGGPFLTLDQIKQIALKGAKAWNGVNVQIDAVVLTTHGKLIDENIFSRSYSLADDREVYIVFLSGTFDFAPHAPQGTPDIHATRIKMEIDATNGDVPANGVVDVPVDSTTLQRLRSL